MLHLETVEYSTLELLRKLQSLPILRDTRLVGGTALALQLGHRKSVDLDFFGTITCEAEELISAIKTVASLIVLKESPHIHIYLVDGIKVDIVNYRYQWLDEPVVDQGIRMAGIKDIAAMKVTALDFYSTKYDDGSVFMAMKSLVYFDDAEKEPMPDMLINKSWEQVKEYILSKIS